MFFVHYLVFEICMRRKGASSEKWVEMKDLRSEILTNKSSMRDVLLNTAVPEIKVVAKWSEKLTSVIFTALLSSITPANFIIRTA